MRGSAEVREIRQHLGNYPPFDGLSDELLDAVADSVDVAYFKSGSSILDRNDGIDSLYYVRSGAVDIYRRNGALYNRLGEGDIFGHFSLLRHRKVHFPAKAIEDTLIYLVPVAVFSDLCEQDEQFADFVELERPRLKSSVEKQFNESSMLTTRVRRLISRPPLILDAATTAREAAARIGAENISGVLVTGPAGERPDRTYQDADGEARELLGILTDSDFRERVIAQGRSVDTPLSELVEPNLISVQSDSTAYDAMLTMLRSNVQHLPVLHRREPVALLHLTDLIRFQTNSSLYLVSTIFNQGSVAGLERLKPDVEAAFLRMVEEGNSSQMIGSALATIGRAFSRRLLELAEQELGPPPVPYCFIALGSMARNEQTIVTDQDNALVLDDSFDPAQHDAYFKQLAKRVSDGLAACGYSYCTGGIMATTDAWRQPLCVWKSYFGDWIDKPDPKRLLHSSIFFDLDSVYGEESFALALQDLVADKAAQSPLFLAAMARNALNRTPPIGFFRNFVMEKDGRQNNTIDAKRRGTAPMTDLIRVHALACGSRAQNSFERLNAIGRTQLLPSGVGERLRYAFEFIAMLRIRQQALDLRHEQPPDNKVDPETISSSERHHLKDAFQVLSDAQKFLRFRYPMP
ncbi:DUF294 nucleotidyltransferase-like domain-containing protein [Methylonatrum kenyense]|uniref:DUF294 nucleotidyltransferase-like domain-containing protein n=1 Tax=Methylonatrum kenyense TaxID=455253 RepID=UPI0020BEAD22|nr:DUF294 nucleotidyltransferase-like domain-containing protein [Methylonatrum kenyense]MCK8515991.1 DUF294 nucleotidyltransferase-like domain-containing protein [Methylonatrum kenyense]